LVYGFHLRAAAQQLLLKKHRLVTTPVKVCLVELREGLSCGTIVLYAYNIEHLPYIGVEILVNLTNGTQLPITGYLPVEIGQNIPLQYDQ